VGDGGQTAGAPETHRRTAVTCVGHSWLRPCDVVGPVAGRWRGRAIRSARHKSNDLPVLPYRDRGVGDEPHRVAVLAAPVGVGCAGVAVMACSAAMSQSEVAELPLTRTAPGSRSSRFARASSWPR
jgi:hypothetical protein